jgi:hypothetical protein
MADVDAAAKKMAEAEEAAVKQAEEAAAKMKAEVEVAAKKKAEAAVKADEEAAAKQQKKKAVREWTVDDVCTFFTELKLGEYTVAITENEVDGHTLLELLAENALGELGIHSALHVIRIKRALKTIEDLAPWAGAQAAVRCLLSCCVALVQLHFPEDRPLTLWN